MVGVRVDSMAADFGVSQSFLHPYVLLHIIVVFEMSVQEQMANNIG